MDGIVSREGFLLFYPALLVVQLYPATPALPGRSPSRRRESVVALTMFRSISPGWAVEWLAAHGCRNSLTKNKRLEEINDHSALMKGAFKGYFRRFVQDRDACGESAAFRILTWKQS